MRANFLNKIEGRTLYQFFPLILLGVVTLAYGLFIPWLGFYLDDWYIVWFRHFFGSAAFTEFFGQDRPFLAWIYVLVTPLMGDSPIAWQTFAVFTRWILGLAFWDLLKQIWPEHKFEAALGALLYSVFPGFQFHWFSVQYSQVYLIEAGMLFSLACSIRAVRTPQHTLRWIFAGLPFGIYALISVEYNFGLELLRPFLIWLALSISGFKFWQRTLKTGLLWLPYLIPLVIYSIWRVFIFSPYQYDVTLPGEITVFSFQGLGPFLLTIGKELLAALVLAWGQIFTPSNYSLAGKSFLLAACVTGFSLIFLLIYLFQLRKSIRAEKSNRWGGMAILLGLLTVILTLIPFKVGGLPVNLSFPWNRFMIVIGLGSVIFAVGVISLLPGTWLKVLLSTLLISLSIASHIDTANGFRLAWADQKKLFWQLTWRIPGLEPNTMLVTDTLSFANYYSGTSLSAPLNWIYDPDLSTRQTHYQLIQTASPQIDSSHTLPANQVYDFQFRSFRFTGNTNQSILFVYNTRDCLQVLSNTTISQRMLSNFYNSPLLTSISMSDLSLINPNPDSAVQPPLSLFEPEPTPDWCYYYLKADLSRQQGDWMGVLDWYDQAEQQGLKPLQDLKIYPKIEALVMTNNWPAALSLTNELLASDPYLSRGMCAIWERSVENNPPQGTYQAMVKELVDLLQCPDLEEVLR